MGAGSVAEFAFGTGLGRSGGGGASRVASGLIGGFIGAGCLRELNGLGGRFLDQSNDNKNRIL